MGRGISGFLVQTLTIGKEGGSGRSIIDQIARATDPRRTVAVSGLSAEDRQKIDDIIDREIKARRTGSNPPKQN